MTAPRRLPINIAPARHELVVSYLGRLATLHGMTYDDLAAEHVNTRIASSPPKRQLVADWIVSLTGRPAAQLAWALPELRDPPPDWRIFRHEPQPACPACTAQHPGGPVFVILPHHRYVCIRHRYWIGPPDTALPMPSLGQLPEIVTAQHRHHRLLHRFGWAATYDAILTAFMICGWYWEKLLRRPDATITTDTFERWMDRTSIMIPPGTTMSTFTTSKLFAAIYPEAVSIAALIGSPHWRRLASGSTDQKRRFVTEIACRLHWPRYQPKITDDAIAHWMHTDAAQPPSTPPKIFPIRRGHRTPSHLTAHFDRKEGARTRSALWFKSNNKGGNTILHHRHIQPVLIREWSTPMAEFAGAIWASQTIRTPYQPAWDLARQYPDSYLPDA